MIWDVDSYLILGEDEHPFSPSGVDLIPPPLILEKLRQKHTARVLYQREHRKRKRGAKG